MSIATPLRTSLPRPLREPPAEAPLVFQPMPFQEYLRLPERPLAEWLDGSAVIHMAPPQYVHANIGYKLSKVIESGLPTLEVTPEGPIKLQEQVFVPDIIVIDPATVGRKWIEVAPIIVVEILSPSTRKYDLTTKSTAYLNAGIRQYWTVDTEVEEIVVRQNADTHWEEIATLDADHPEIAVEVDGYGMVTVDRDQLFG